MYVPEGLLAQSPQSACSECSDCTLINYTMTIAGGKHQQADMSD